MLREHLGPGGEALRMISPGTKLNAGHGIRMALAAGARAAGDWRGMHIEPIDPRSQSPAPVVLVYPYGIVVDAVANRFCDEGADFRNYTYAKYGKVILNHLLLPRPCDDWSSSRALPRTTPRALSTLRPPFGPAV
jgi:tricarballylate dehydrogenase